MKSLIALAALGAVTVLPVGFAQAQTNYGAPGYHDYYAEHAHEGSRYEYGYGSGTLINNSNCPAGTSPHVWPNGSGYRCLPD